MSAASCLAGCLLILVNIIFLIIGLALAAAGGVLKWGSSVFIEYVRPIIAQIISNIPNSDPQSVNTFIDDVLRIITPISTALLIVGIILFVISICGMCGVCCKTKYLLIPYIIIVGVILACFLGFFIWFAVSRSTLATSITTELNKWIKNEYKGLSGTNLASMFWNFLNMMFSCCGVTNGTDFVNAPGWSRYFNASSGGRNVNITLTYPVSCCKMENMKPVSLNCTWDPTPQNNNYEIGCWSKVSVLYDQYTSYAVGAAGGLCGVLAILLTLGILVLCGLKKSSVDPY